MKSDLIKIYTDELGFLLKLKKSIGPLNNRIHDTLASIAIEKLRIRFPKLSFKYGGAGLPGFDIQAFDKNGRKNLIAEVKTTSGEELRGPQARAIKKDLDRLSKERVKYKILILLSSDIRNKVQKRINVKKNYPDIEIINALDS